MENLIPPHIRKERGFTLIELLTIIGIIGVLSAIAITSFSLYRSSAAYAVCQRLISDSRTALEASAGNSDNLPPAVAYTTQQSPGTLTDASARAVLPSIEIPYNVSLALSYDPSCDSAGCQSAQVVARHKSGKKYAELLRFGDGISVTIENIGSGW